MLFFKSGNIYNGNFIKLKTMYLKWLWAIIKWCMKELYNWDFKKRLTFLNLLIYNEVNISKKIIYMVVVGSIVYLKENVSRAKVSFLLFSLELMQFLLFLENKDPIEIILILWLPLRQWFGSDFYSFCVPTNLIVFVLFNKGKWV